MISPSKFQSELSALGFSSFQSNKDKVMTSHLVGTVAGAAKFTDMYKSLSWTKQANRDAVRDLYSRAGGGFHGASFDQLKTELAGNVDMTPFREQRDKFCQSDLSQKLKASMQLVCPRRKRMLSEHDGQYDHDRRWEILPFEATTRQPVATRVVDIECYFNILGSSSPQAINQFGATAWAISQLVESTGVQTRVWAINTSTYTSAKGARTEVKIELKRPGQYIAPNVLAGAFSAQFYRRLLFSLMTAACECVGHEVSYGYGSSEHGQAITFSDGKLKVHAAVRNAYSETIEAEILKALGIKKDRKVA